MESVEPIRDLNTIEKLKAILHHQSYRNYFLFVFALNTGLRIEQMLKLKVKDVINRDYIEIVNKNSHISYSCEISPFLKDEINKYIQIMTENEYLFYNSRTDCDNQPILRGRVYRFLNAAAQCLGIEQIGTHTMRKTFGYFHYMEFGDIEYLKKLFHHSSTDYTLKYIGLEAAVKTEYPNSFRI